METLYDRIHALRDPIDREEPPEAYEPTPEDWAAYDKLGLTWPNTSDADPFDCDRKMIAAANNAD